MKNIFIYIKRYILLFFLLVSSFVFSQITFPKPKSKPDSLYYKLEKASDKSFTGRLFHNLFFRSPEEVDSYDLMSEIKNYSTKHKGKYIRNIIIKVYDPFVPEASARETANDTIKHDEWIKRAGNSIHGRTKPFIIRNMLLFKKGEKYNVQKVDESERLLRSKEFVSQVRILAVDSTATRDSVDVLVRVLDDWTLIPHASYSSSKLGFGLTEENLLGYGMELETYYRYNYDSKQNDYIIKYTIDNILESQVRFQTLYQNNFNNDFKKNISLERKFFSPLARWGGGILLEGESETLDYRYSASVAPEDILQTTIRHHQQDFWAGLQFPLFNKEKEKRISNISAALRFQNLSYAQTIEEKYDPTHFLSDSQLFLGTLAFHRRDYKIDYNIFRYNVPEDIPYGYLISATGGMMKKNGENMPYVGAKLAYGKYFKLGYLNAELEWGSFFKEGNRYMSTTNIGFTYFTRPFDVKIGQARYFLSPQFVLGNNRDTSYRDKVSLSHSEEFEPYDRNYVGKDKFIIRNQIQLFPNASWKGFHINPFFITTLGLMSDESEDKSLFKSKLHSKFGLGLLITNRYLVLNRFQLSFAYYPNIPFDENGGIDFNNYRNYDMPIHDFIVNKPEIVQYR